MHLFCSAFTWDSEIVTGGMGWLGGGGGAAKHRTNRRARCCLHFFILCVCVRVCVRACVRACVRVCVRVCVRHRKNVCGVGVGEGIMYTGKTMLWGARIAQWLEHRTHDWKITGLSPCRSSRIIFSSRINFLCWLLFRYPFHPCVTAVAHKRYQSFCQKCRWQVTAKHAYTLRMWFCMKWHGAWLCGVHRMRQDGSSFMWHQPCQRCKYTTSVDIQ